jgi:hypothetical protein
MDYRELATETEYSTRISRECSEPAGLPCYVSYRHIPLHTAPSLRTPPLPRIAGMRVDEGTF